MRLRKEGRSSTILVVSDMHFEVEYHHGTYQYGALEWLLGVIRRVKPNTLIGLGDWGTAWKDEDWEALTSLIPVMAIYGNHENIGLLQSVRNKDDTPVLMKDGEVLTLEDLRFGFINGIMAERLERLKPVPRKSQYDFLRFAKSLVGVDVLCTHESPLVPSFEKRLHPSTGTSTMN